MLLKKIINFSFITSLVLTIFSFFSCNSGGRKIVVPNLDDNVYYSNNGELQEQCYFYVDNNSVSPDDWFISSYYFDGNNQKKECKNFSISSYGRVSWTNLEETTYYITIIAIFDKLYYFNNNLKINIKNDYHLQGDILTYHDADISQFTPVIGPKWSLLNKEGEEVVDEDNPIVYDINLGWWSGIEINIDTGVIHFTPSIFEGAYPYYVTALYKDKKYVSSSCYIYVYRSSNFLFQNIDDKTCSVTTNPNIDKDSFNKELYIPPIYKGKTIVAIGNNFLSGCVKFNSPILFPETITKIGNYFMNKCSNFNQVITWPKSIDHIGHFFMHDCYSFNNAGQDFKIPDSIVKIKNYFLANCFDFNVPILFPINLQSIGTHFLNSCLNYNYSLTFPKTLKTIGAYFLSNCESFNCELELPNHLTDVDTLYFMYECKSFTNKIYINCAITSLIIKEYETNFTCSTREPDALCYINGIQILGLNRVVFKQKFPNIVGSVSDNNCYRKLI